MTTFGFLLGSDIFTVDLPGYVQRQFDLCSTVGIDAAWPFSVQCSPDVDVNFADFGWKNGEATNGDPSVIAYRLPGSPEVIMPSWRFGKYVAWMQIRARRANQVPQLLKIHLDNIHPVIDANGIPRLQLGRKLSPGNPIQNAVNRDHVIFRVRSEKRTIILRNDGAIGTDKLARDSDWSLITVTTPLGISVVCDGPYEQQGRLVAEARAIAASLHAG